MEAGYGGGIDPEQARFLEEKLKRLEDIEKSIKEREEREAEAEEESEES